MRWDRAQGLYEDICAGKAGWIALVRLSWYKLSGWFWKAPLEHHSILVNAAAVGGLRDERKYGAVVIEI